ncbi:hypothetical protein FRB94_008243 [Tulasnella sp. JGI-2019a]|nr:hypothetical protein FRB94_008243 [Tulasnella sp. JGI-2019a]
MPDKRLKTSLPTSRKRQKTSSSNEDVKSLEQSLLVAVQAGSSLNPLSDLIALVSSSSDPQTTHSVIYAVYRIVVALSQAGKLGQEGNGTEEAKIVRQWLDARVASFSELLAGLLKDDEKALRMGALEIMLSLIIHLSKSVSATGRLDIHLSHFRHLVHGLLVCPPSPRPTSDPGYGQGPGRIEIDVRDKFLEENLTVHDDLRWFFLREAAVIMSSPSLKSPNAAHNLLSLLEKLDTMPTDVKEINAFWIPEFAKRPKKAQQSDHNQSSDTEDEQDNTPEAVDDWRTFFDELDQNASAKTPKGKRRRLNQLSVHAALHVLHSHRVQFSNCWLALVPHLAESQLLSTRALAVLHRGVLPHMTRPIQVMDWVAGCVDHGGSIGLLGLNGLFTLIRDHNLDYPDFYTRLYAFIDRDVMHLKHRARFFRLTELFLSSIHLPATLLASFVKRLSRLSLTAPPPAIIMTIPFVYNILRKHPALMIMIHQEPQDNYQDPFDPNETSPLLTNALSSSLWELAAHQNHYLTSISTLSKIFSSPFTKMPYAMEEFLDHTYTTLFATEAKRNIKKDPAMILQFPAGKVFPATSDGGITGDYGGGDDVVSELWSFG